MLIWSASFPGSLRAMDSCQRGLTVLAEVEDRQVEEAGYAGGEEDDVILAQVQLRQALERVDALWESRHKTLQSPRNAN